MYLLHSVGMQNHIGRAEYLQRLELNVPNDSLSTKDINIHSSFNIKQPEHPLLSNVRIHSRMPSLPQPCIYAAYATPQAYYLQYIHPGHRKYRQIYIC
jgi:hypothetical protein